MTKLYEVKLNSKGMPNFSTAKEMQPPGVIRCKECKHFKAHRCYERRHINAGCFVYANGFCVWAGRDQTGPNDEVN